MSPIVRTFLRINLRLLQLNWQLLATLIAGHFLIAWSLMTLAQESTLTSYDVFYYFYLVTASTVGYGDFSPQTHAGQIVTSLFIIPGGTILFAGVIGKITTTLVNAWRMNMKGQLDLNSQLHDHLVIMGWHRETTSRMIDLIYGDQRRQTRDVVLVSTREMDNPDPDRVSFIKTDNLASEDAWWRAGLAKAARIIITGHNDDNTLTTALSLAAGDTKAHVVCYFDDPDMARLLKAHAPEVECHISTTIEMLVRSAQDPGSSRVQSQLLSTLTGPTQFSMQIPENCPPCSFAQLITFFKTHHDVLVLGVANSIQGDDLTLNPPADYHVKAGMLVYYMSQHRLMTGEINWQKLPEIQQAS